MTIQTYKQLEKWLTKTPLGREILHRERIFYNEQVRNVFGLYSLQIGIPEINMLQGNKIINNYNLPSNIMADGIFLPFKENSIDLIVLPHVLEYSSDVESMLKELYRILSPNGKIILSVFNTNSWLNLRKRKIQSFKNMQFQDLTKLKNLVTESKFHIEGGKFFSYCPPLKSAKNLRNISWMNKFGDRWFPTYANSFALIINKNIDCSNIITSKLEISTHIRTKVPNVCNKN